MALLNQSNDAATLHCRLTQCGDAAALRNFLDSLKVQSTIGAAFGEAVARFIRPDITKSSHIEARAALIGAVGIDFIHLLLPLLSKTTNNEEAQWLASAVSNLTTYTVIRSLFGTAAARDALVSMAACATTADSVQWLASAVSNITDDVGCQALFGTKPVRDALVLMASRATTADSVQSIATAIRYITKNAGNKTLFCTVAVRDALVLMAPRATTADSVQWLASAVSSITNNACNQALFCTEPVRDALVLMAPFATTADSVQRVATAVRNISSNPGNQALFGTEPVRDALVLMAPFATTADSVQRFAAAVSNITNNAGNQALFGTKPARDALVLMASRATTADSVQSIATAVRYITKNAGNQALFGTKPARDALVLMAPRATTADSVQWLASAVSSITNNACSQALFGTEPVRDALVLMAPRATTADSVQRVATAVRNISSNPGNQALFGTEPVRDALVLMAPRATTADSVQRFAAAVSNITNNVGNQALFDTEPVRDALVLMASRATTADSVQSIATAIRYITKNAGNKTLFGTEPVRDALVLMAPRATTADSVQWLASAVSSITKNACNQALFCTEPVRDALVLMAPRATTADSVQRVATAVRNISSNPGNQALFGTEPVRDALVLMAPFATTADSVQRFAAAVSNITNNAGNQALFDTEPVRDALVLMASRATADRVQPSVRNIANNAGLSLDGWMECSDGYCEPPGATLMLTSLPTRDNPNARNRNLSQYVDSVDVLVREVNRSVGEGSAVGAAFMGGNFAFAYVAMKDVATAERIAQQGGLHLLERWRCKAVLKQTVSRASSLQGDPISSVGKIELRLPWDGRAPQFLPSLDSVFARECHVVHDHTGTATFSCLCDDAILRDDRKRAFVELNRLIGGALLHYATFPKLNLVLSPRLDFDAATSIYPPRTKLYLAAMWALLHASGLGEVKLYGGCIRDGIVKGYLDEKGDIDVSYTASLSIEAVIAAVNSVCTAHRLPVSLASSARQKDNCHCAIARLTTGGDGGIAPTVDVEFTSPGDFYTSVMDLSFNNFELSAVKGLTQKYPGQGGLLMHAIHDSICKVGFIVNPEDSDYQRGRRCKRLADGYHLVNGDRHGGRLEGDAGDIPSTFDRAHALHLHVQHRCGEDSPGTCSQHAIAHPVTSGEPIDEKRGPNAPAAMTLFGRNLQALGEQAC